MRILQVNKYYYIKSGTERYMFNLIRLLESQGHTVAAFSMHHPRNQPSPFADYFVPQVDYRRLRPIGQAQAAIRALWYPTAARWIEQLLDEFSRTWCTSTTSITRSRQPSCQPSGDTASLLSTRCTTTSSSVPTICCARRAGLAPVAKMGDTIRQCDTVASTVP